MGMVLAGYPYASLFKVLPLVTFFQLISDPQGNRAFVQMPLLTRGEEWLKSDECSSEASIHVFSH